MFMKCIGYKTLGTSLIMIMFITIKWDALKKRKEILLKAHGACSTPHAGFNRC